MNYRPFAAVFAAVVALVMIVVSLAAMADLTAAPVSGLAARSSGQLSYELGAAAPLVPTTVKVDGKIRPGIRGGRARVVISGVECARVEPSGAVVVDMLCCRWEATGNGGEHRLVGRSDFSSMPPSVRQRWRKQCTALAGAPWR